MNIDIFVENVKSHCRIMGVSPSKACHDSGAGDTLLDNIKRGRIPSIERVELLAKFFGCTIGELIGEDTSGADKGPAQPYLVSRYNALSQDDQMEIMTLVEMKYKKALREVQESGKDEGKEIVTEE